MSKEALYQELFPKHYSSEKVCGLHFLLNYHVTVLCSQNLIFTSLGVLGKYIYRFQHRGLKQILARYQGRLDQKFLTYRNPCMNFKNCNSPRIIDNVLWLCKCVHFLGIKSPAQKKPIFKHYH